MNAVGIFAGRGDVIVGYALAVAFGFWLGWQVHRLVVRWRGRRAG